MKKIGVIGSFILVLFCVGCKEVVEEELDRAFGSNCVCSIRLEK